MLLEEVSLLVLAKPSLRDKRMTNDFYFSAPYQHILGLKRKLYRSIPWKEPQPANFF